MCLDAPGSYFVRSSSYCCFRSLSGVDSRGKGPLLHLEAPGSVWPPPQSGPSRVLGESATELEAPLLAPSAPLMQFDTADDRLLDDFSTEVWWSGEKRLADRFCRVGILCHSPSSVLCNVGPLVEEVSTFGSTNISLLVCECLWYGAI